MEEVARYVGYSRLQVPDEAVSRMMREACEAMHPLLSPRCVYDRYPLMMEGCRICFADVDISSKDLSRNLSGCSELVLFAATIGSPVDSLIRRTQARDKALAAVMQAAGAMFIESFVDDFNRMVKEEAAAAGRRTHPRYSPGYGDVPLSVQKHFFSLLQCYKINLTLMDTLIMAPEKSVTAFIGLEELG